MSVKYTNCEGRTYCLYERRTSRGRAGYYFSLESSESVPVGDIPEGYEIYENSEGDVFLRKKENFLNIIKYLV